MENDRMVREEPLFSIVIPVYGNEKNIPVTIPQIVEELKGFSGIRAEIIMVCDGSPDNSYREMVRVKNEYPDMIRIAKLTRNFGQAPAIHCGIKMSKGDVIGVYSCDGQDPFCLFKDMLDAWKRGFKLVIASRKSRGEKGAIGFLSNLLHKFTNKYIDNRYPKGGFDFYLMDRQVAEQYCEIDIANGSAAMQLIWLGYEYYEIPYERMERKIGKSGYKVGRKIKFAIGLITSYSPILSQVWFMIGVIFFLLFCVTLVTTIILLIQESDKSLFMGLTSIFLICTSLMLWAVSSVGEYIWRIYDNTKNRPRYVVEEMDE